MLASVAMHPPAALLTRMCLALNSSTSACTGATIRSDAKQRETSYFFLSQSCAGYTVLVEKAGNFLEKVGLVWKKPYFFSVGQVLVVRRKSCAFSKQALLFPKLPGFLIILGIPSLF
jgi:hypothetical protein